MKIKLALLDNDLGYVNKIVSTFGTKYADKVELYSFTDWKTASESLKSLSIDVLLASDQIEIDQTMLPSNCGFAYLVDNQGIDLIEETKAICKYQKVDLIYKQILDVYSETAKGIANVMADDGTCKTILFESPAGGVGTSTMAAAFATYLASAGKKVLYLCFQDFGETDLLFQADGQFGMSDVIYALKSKKANFALKLESCVKKDARGVDFYSDPKVVLDMMEFSYEEKARLLRELKLVGGYDYIVVDTDFSIRKEAMWFAGLCNRIVYISDGSKAANHKLSNLCDAIKLIDEQQEVSIKSKVAILYNNFGQGCVTIQNQDFPVIGGGPHLENMDTNAMISRLSTLAFWEKLL